MIVCFFSHLSLLFHSFSPHFLSNSMKAAFLALLLFKGLSAARRRRSGAGPCSARRGLRRKSREALKQNTLNFTSSGVLFKSFACNTSYIISLYDYQNHTYNMYVHITREYPGEPVAEVSGVQNL